MLCKGSRHRTALDHTNRAHMPNTAPEPVTSVLERARAVMLQRPDLPPQSATVGRNNQLANDWLGWLRDTANRTPSTVYNYASVVARYLDECVGDRPLSEVPPADIETWLLRGRPGRAMGAAAKPATRARNTAILRSFYGWLVDRQLVDLNVAAQLVAPKVQNRQPKAIPDGVWQHVWTHAEGQAFVVLGLGFFFGLRRGEIAALQPHHVDVARRQLVGFPRKGGGDDTFPAGEICDVWTQCKPDLVAPHSMDLLWQRLQTLSERPCGPSGTLVGLTSPDEVNRLLGRFLGRVGTPRAFTPHALRHSFVTNLLRCSMPIEMVSELANHSDLSTTMRYVRGGGGRVSEWRQQVGVVSPTVTVSDWRR